ncbi:MAG: GGDEF domain-containing protein [Aliarcobacter sp.]|nr:GGDEF domain-containing protein [Aliarcobacter sp.]
MMNNAITIEYANKVIDEMQVDALTGLQRKDMFGEFITQQMQKVYRKTDSTVFSLAIIDIDNFKSVNDTYGHYSGDQVLKDIGRIILKNIRSTDIGFRIGGDELAIIFKSATKEASQKVCHKIMEDLKDINFMFNEEITFKITLSIGIMEYNPQSGDDWESFL